MSLRKQTVAERQTFTSINRKTSAPIASHGMSDEQLASLSDADRREIALIAHQGGTSFELDQQRIDAAADPATTAAVDALIAANAAAVAELDALSPLVSAVPSQNPSIYPDREPLQGKSPERCPNVTGILLKGAGTGKFVGYAKRCNYRTCPACFVDVAAKKLADFDEVLALVSPQPMTLFTFTIPESEFRKAKERVLYRGFSGRAIPVVAATGEFAKVIVTDDPREGVPVTRDEAREILDAAQRALVSRSVGKRQATFFGEWGVVHNAAGKQRKAEDEAAKAEDPERLEFAGFYTSQKHFAEACEILKMQIEETVDEDSTTLTTGIPVLREVEDTFKILIGHISPEQLAYIAETKAARLFEEKTKALAKAAAIEAHRRQSFLLAVAAREQAHQIAAQRIPPPSLFARELVAA